MRDGRCRCIIVVLMTMSLSIVVADVDPSSPRGIMCGDWICLVLLPLTAALHPRLKHDDAAATAAVAASSK